MRPSVTGTPFLQFREAGYWNVAPPSSGNPFRQPFCCPFSVHFGLPCPVEGVAPDNPQPPPDSGRKSAAFWPLYAAERSPGILKQLQRWQRLGKEVGTPAPLGNPVAMVEWYGQMRRAGHITHVCPSVLTEAAAKYSTTTPDLAAPKTPKTTQNAQLPLPGIPTGPPEILTPKRRLEALEDEEARLHRRYVEVLSRGGTDSELDVHRARWAEMSELVVQTRQRLEKSRDILDPSEVNTALPAFFTALMQAVVRELAADFPADKVKEAVRRAWKRAPDNVAQLLAA